MERSGEGSYDERWEARERARLPADARDRWDEAVGRKVLRPLPFQWRPKNMTAKALSRQAPATRATLLNRYNRLLDLAVATGLPGDLKGLLDPWHLHLIFETAGAALSSQTVWGLCTALWRMAWELGDVAAPWIFVGARRYRLEDDGEVRPVDPELPDRVRARARQMHAELPPGAPLTMGQAIKLRSAAHATLQADLGARRSEVACPKLQELKFGPAGLILLLDGAHSKVGANGREAICDATAALLEDYLRRGRPVLLGRGLDGPLRGLWITEDGLDAEGATMAAAFARAMKDLRPEGVCCTDLRRALLSQEGQSFEDMARRARHAPGSRTGPIVYTGRDRASAVASGIGLSTIGEDDVPSFAPPAPGKRRRNR